MFAVIIIIEIYKPEEYQGNHSHTELNEAERNGRRSCSVRQDCPTFNICHTMHVRLENVFLRHLITSMEKNRSKWYCLMLWNYLILFRENCVTMFRCLRVISSQNFSWIQCVLRSHDNAFCLTEFGFRAVFSIWFMIHRPPLSSGRCRNSHSASRFFDDPPKSGSDHQKLSCHRPCRGCLNGQTKPDD